MSQGKSEEKALRYHVKIDKEAIKALKKTGELFQQLPELEDVAEDAAENVVENISLHLDSNLNKNDLKMAQGISADTLNGVLHLTMPVTEAEDDALLNMQTADPYYYDDQAYPSESYPAYPEDPQQFDYLPEPVDP